jgi:hypothetical protein
LFRGEEVGTRRAMVPASLAAAYRPYSSGSWAGNQKVTKKETVATKL